MLIFKGNEIKWIKGYNYYVDVLLLNDLCIKINNRKCEYVIFMYCGIDFVYIFVLNEIIKLMYL